MRKKTRKSEGDAQAILKEKKAARRRYLRTAEGRAEMEAKRSDRQKERSDRQKERTARQQEKERAAAKKAYLESLISRKDLIEKYGISEKDVTKALKGVEPDEVEEIRGMSWGRNNRGRYLYRSDNPAILRLLPLPMERMHEEYDYNR